MTLNMEIDILQRHFYVTSIQIHKNKLLSIMQKILTNMNNFT